MGPCLRLETLSEPPVKIGEKVMTVLYGEYNKRQRILRDPIGQVGQPIGRAMHTEHPLESGIVVLEIGGTDRPGDPALLRINAVKILIGQPERDAAPGEATATDLQTTGPEKGTIRRMAVGMKLLVGVQPRIGFPVPGVLGLEVTLRLNPRQGR